MHGVTTINKCISSDSYVKTYDFTTKFGRQNYDTEKACYEALHGTGITPELIRTTPNSIEMACWGKTLKKYIVEHPDRKNEIAIRVYEKIKYLNLYGIQHRDLHEQNIVIVNDDPKFIDWELAILGTRMDRPYDLYGPTDKVRPSDPHIDYRIEVFWDATGTIKSLANTLGLSVVEVQALVAQGKEQ